MITSTTHYLRDYSYKSHSLHDNILTVHTDGLGRPCRSPDKGTVLCGGQ